MTLELFFRDHPKVAIAFSGGTDSAFLLWAAKKYCNEVHVYYVKRSFNLWLSWRMLFSYLLHYKPQ